MGKKMVYAYKRIDGEEEFYYQRKEKSPELGSRPFKKDSDVIIPRRRDISNVS